MTTIRELLAIGKFEDLVDKATTLIRSMTPEQTEQDKILLNHDDCDLELSEDNELVFYLGILVAISTIAHLNPTFPLLFGDEIHALTIHSASHIDQVMYRHEMNEELEKL